MRVADNAIVTVAGQRRPAAFLFATPDGMAWVEPSYAFDQQGGAPPAFHRVAGSVAVQGRVITVTDAGAGQVEFAPADAAHDDAEGSCRAALADWNDWLVEEGRTLEDERARLLELLAEDLA